MAAAANHNNDQSCMDETFLLSNMAPQVGKGFNRGSWALLERRVREIAKQCDVVHVISGPLFLPSNSEVTYPVIGSNDIAVPTHFFKIITAEGPNDQLRQEAYIMSNRAINKDEPLHKFASTIEKVQRLAGIALNKMP